MANRDLTAYRQDINEVAPQQAIPTPDPVPNELATIGQNLIAKSQEAKINENISKAQLGIAELNQKYQDNNQGDPFKNLEELKQNRSDLLSSYGEDISPYFKGAWNNSVKKLTAHDDLKTELWAYQQTKKNTADSINQSMANNFAQANQDGQDFGTGKINSLDGILNYEQSKKQLEVYGSKNLGETHTGKLLDGYEQDYMKSFIAGVAQNNPQKAAMLLDKPEFKDQFTSQERDEFANLIEKTRKGNELIKSLQVTQNSQQVTDIVNDPNQTYFQKRLAIDKMDMSGSISPKMASQARRVLTSAKDVDSITNSDEMGGIITKIYDLNSQQGLNNSDYLKGVQDIHAMIVEKQADGKLTAQDVTKINNEMKTLTSKKISDSTRSVGNEMYDAVDKFKVLPPEWRGEATRQLFYATQGQSEKLDAETYANYTKATAQSVIDSINRQRRASAVKAIQQAASPAPDTDFLKSKGYTVDDVNETARKYKTTPEEVIKRLRNKK